MRKTLIITIPGRPSKEPGERDNGKTFRITELPADRAERLCIRLFSLGSDSGPASSAALAGSSINLNAAALDADLDAELWSCVAYQHTPQADPQPIQTGESSQIEEAATRTFLRKEVMSLHLGFFMLGAHRLLASSTSPAD